MKTKIAAALVAALTLGAASVATTSQAEAHHWGNGWGWGGVGLGLALGAAAASTYAYHDCYWARQFDSYGRYIGRAKVCN
jgi:hypothetical protein